MYTHTENAMFNEKNTMALCSMSWHDYIWVSIANMSLLQEKMPCTHAKNSVKMPLYYMKQVYDTSRIAAEYDISVIFGCTKDLDY